MYNKEFEIIFDYARNLADDIEIMLSSGTSFSVKIHDQEIEAFNYADSKGISVRVIKNGKVGYAYTEKFDEKTFKLIVNEALDNCRYSENDEVVVLENYPDINQKLDVYSEELDKVDIKDKLKFAMNMEKIAKSFDKRVFNVPYSVMGDGKAYVKIANSKGLNKEDKQNYAFAFVSSLTEEKDDKRVGSDFIISRNFKEFNAQRLAENSVKKSVALLGGKEIKSGKYPVVLNNEMTATILATFSGLFSAKAVQEGKSLLKGKLGELIANNTVTIVDNALYPGGFSTRAFDSEGYPSQKTVLIDKGKLNSLLHNTVTARKDGVKSTGNGTRSYKGSLSISSTNYYLEPGNVKENELFKNYDNIIEIVALQGMHSGANSISGDFSLSAEGFLYEKGKKKYSLKQFTVSGNILKLLNDVEAVADNFKFNMSSYGASSVLIKELVISG
jgi:PmbA protein